MRNAAPAFVVSVVLLTQSLFFAASSGVAQESWIGVPEPADCRGEPVSAAEIVAALAEGGEAPADPDAIPLIGIEESDLPVGSPAGVADVDAVSAEMWAAIACVNSGDFGRFFSYLTPAATFALVAGLFEAFGRAPGPFTQEELANLEDGLSQGLQVNPEELVGDDRGRIDAIRDVRVLEDGRILLLADGRIVVDGAGYIIFKRVDGEWKIDRLGQLGDIDMLGIGSGETDLPPIDGDDQAAPTSTPSGESVVSTPAPGSLALDAIDRIAHHEISAWEVGPTWGGDESPILSDDGRTIAFSRSPGSGDPATPNEVFVIDAAGGSERQIDAFTTLCYCGTLIDISADGSRVVASDSVQLRVAESSGSEGRELFTLASNELDAVRISGDGQTIVFRVYRNTTFKESAEPISHGIYAIDPDGQNLRMLAGSDSIAAALGTTPEQVPASGGSSGVDVSFDGSRVVSTVFFEPQEGGVGQAVISIDGEGQLLALTERVWYVASLAISGDGSTVAMVYIEPETNITVAAVVEATGGEIRRLTDSSPPPTGIEQGLTSSFERITLTTDGALLLLGSTGLLFDTASGAMLALSVADGSSMTGPAPLVDGVPEAATMDAAARRIAYLSHNSAGVPQLVIADLNPDDAGDAPVLSDLTSSPDSIGLSQAGNVTVTVAVTASGSDLRVGVGALRGGRLDLHILGRTTLLADDGVNSGDATAGDGTFTTDDVAADCCADPGPRSIRVKAEVVGADGLRDAATLEAGEFTVTE